MSWAQAVQSTVVQAPKEPVPATEARRVLIIDANSLIASSNLTSMATLADRIVTTPEVYSEIRDKKSREALYSLPFTIETIDPSEEDVRAGKPW